MSNCKVLVADDVFANQFLLASMLEELSVGFKTVANGQEVLDELSNDKYDLIFITCRFFFCSICSNISFFSKAF